MEITKFFTLKTLYKSIAIGMMASPALVQADLKYKVYGIGALDGVDSNSSYVSSVNVHGVTVGYSGKEITKAFLYNAEKKINKY